MFIDLKARGRSVDRRSISSEAETNKNFQARSLSSAPLNVKELAKEICYKDPGEKLHNNDDDSDDEKKPYVKKAVNVWRARKKEEAKLKRRYQVLCNKYQRPPHKL